MLKKDLPRISDIERSNRPKKLPIVFTPDEVKAVLRRLSGTYWIMASLLYGSGLRLMECVGLRVKDLEFQYNQITVRSGKGEKDRITILPQSVKEPLRRHLARVKLLHEEDMLQRAVRRAIRQTSISKPGNCHTFRHSFATHLIEDGYDIRTVQER